MLRPGVNLQLVHHVPSEFVLGHHAADSVEDQVFRLASLTITIAFQTEPGVTRVPGVVPHVHFAAGHAHLFRIDDYDEVAAIDVGRVFGTMLAHQDHRDVTRQPPENLIGGVHYEPILFQLAGLGDVASLSDHSQKTALKGVFRKPNGQARNQVRPTGIEQSSGR